MLCFPQREERKGRLVTQRVPPGGSIHKTSAPKSANTWLTCAPTRVGDRSITVSPSRAAAEATGGSGVMARNDWMGLCRAMAEPGGPLSIWALRFRLCSSGDQCLRRGRILEFHGIPRSGLPGR